LSGGCPSYPPFNFFRRDSGEKPGTIHSAIFGNDFKNKQLMRLIFLIELIIIHVACTPPRNMNLKASKNADLAIAYNIAVKDAAGKSNYEVFTMNMDGSESKNITNHPDVAWTYMSFERVLYFVSDRDTCTRCYFLYKTEVNGKNVQKVSNMQLEDSWMDTRNNGKEIIVSGRIGREVRLQLFIINAETGTYQQLTNDTTASYRDPAFSPDGKRIAYIYKKNKRDRSLTDEVFVMNADGSDVKQLTTYPKDNVSRNSNGYKAGAVRWHPTENYLTYISMQDGKHSIFAVMPDGSKQWKLTSNNFSEGWHDWSDDGNWLTFDMANQDESQYHIMLMNWKTKEVKKLTDSAHKYQQSPVFILK
jgi:TolB protein